MNGNFSASAHGSIHASRSLPFVGDLVMLAEDYLGISNPGIDTALIFDNNGAGTEVAFLWISVAAFIDRTGDLRLGDNLSEITAQKQKVRPELQVFGSVADSQNEITISSSFPWAIIALDWQESYTHFDLITPTGHQLTPSIGIVEDATALYTRNTTRKRAFYALKEPAIGTYSLSIQYPDRIGDVTASLIVPNSPAEGFPSGASRRRFG